METLTSMNRQAGRTACSPQSSNLESGSGRDIALSRIAGSPPEKRAEPSTPWRAEI